jgi:outer membrane protein assembly factor BamB
MRTFLRAVAPVVCTLLAGSGAYAQRGVGDWSTAGFDAQRSSWVRGDAKINAAALRKGGFALDWKLNLNDKRAARHTLTPPLLIDFYIGYRGFRALGFVGSGPDGVAAIDTDLGRLEWKKDFNSPRSAATGPCSSEALLIARPSNPAYPPLSTQFRGVGRGTPAKSAVGEPGEGAVTLKTAMARMASTPVASSKPTPQPVAPPVAAPKRRATADDNPFAPRIQWLYALTGDGKLHSLYVSNGEEPNPAIPFIGANAKASGLTVIDNVAYVSTSGGCAGVADGVYSIDLPAKKTSHWASASKRVSAPAFGPDGTLYVVSGNELVALEERTLARKSSYKLPQGEFTSMPLVFEFKSRDLIAAASDDGRVHLLHGGSAVASAAGSTTGAMASWQDAAGVRWLLAPSKSSVVAWKVVEQDGAVKLQPGWTSPEMTSPATPIVVSDVVFAVSSGAPAVLYALDAVTGREVWNSGSAITGQVRNGGLSAGGTRVYVATQDGTQYAFSFPIEH